jgi:hypothetical protein
MPSEAATLAGSLPTRLASLALPSLALTRKAKGSPAKQQSRLPKRP